MKNTLKEASTFLVNNTNKKKYVKGNFIQRMLKSRKWNKALAITDKGLKKIAAK